MKEKIRNRKSYLYWKNLALDFKRNGVRNIGYVLLHIHEIVDKRRGYKSERNSEYSLTSLKLVKKDLCLK